MALLRILCAALLVVSAKGHCIPAIPQCQPDCLPTPITVVGTTIVDNTVSNALANALQLLIVSNLIENTMAVPGSCCPNALQSIAPLCESLPIPAPMYTPAIDVFVPDCCPSRPCHPINPCDYRTPYEPVIEVVPNIYYPDILPTTGCNCVCDNTYMPDYWNGWPETWNVGSNCGCGTGYNFVPNCGSNNNLCCSYTPNCGSCNNMGCSCTPNCGCAPSIGGNCGCGNILSSLLPSLGCSCNNFAYEPYGLMCDNCAPVVSEIIYPSAVPAPVSCNCGYGFPSYPVGMSVDPWGYDSCCYGNAFYL